MSLNGLALLAPLPPDGSDDPGYQLSLVPDWFRQLLGRPLLGRLTPDAPLLQGKPKPAPKKVRPLQPEHPVGHGPFKCRYCGRYGQPGACSGCGAPNQPVALDAPLPPRRPDTIMRAGMLTPNEARQIMGLNQVPQFDMVKR